MINRSTLSTPTYQFLPFLPKSVRLNWRRSLCIAFLTLYTHPIAYTAPVTLNLKDTEINTLIQTIAQITGKNFVVDPRVKGTVSLVSSRPMEEEEVYQVFLSILAVNNFAAIPAGNVIKIVPSQNAKQEATPLIDDGSALSGGDQRITRVIPVKNVAAAQIVPIVRPLIPPEGHLAAYTPTNVLILSDSLANVERLTQIIEKIDQASDETVEMITLRFASAIALEKTLNSLNTGAQNTAADPNTAALMGNSPNASARVVADERSNSLLVSGSPQARERLKTLIQQLDHPLKSGNTHVIYLSYAKAKDVLPIIQGIARNLTKDGFVATDNAQDANKGLDASRIHADEATNALIINADVTQFEEIKSIVTSLDVRRAQVLVEAVIAEISYSKSKQIGVQWVLGGDTAYGLLNFTNAGLSATALGAITQADDIAGTAAKVIGNNPLGGLLLGSDSGSVKFGALVQALGMDADTNVLSTPSLVTLDNEEAEMVVGQNVPFVTGTFTTQADSGSLNNPFQTIERQDVGITLKIRPQINKGNAIKLEIAQEVSNIVADSSKDANGPTTTKRALKTNVIVEDGQVLVLGGLMDDQVRETAQKVPGLGDLPLVGNLFKSRSADTEKRNLMIFLRPVILKDAYTTDLATQNKYQLIQQAQIQAQQNPQSLLGAQDKKQLPDLSTAQQQGFTAQPPATTQPPVEKQKKNRVNTLHDPYGK